MSYYKFRPVFGSKKTKAWAVVSSDGATTFGHINWHRRVKRYVFSPSARKPLVFAADGLRQISEFCVDMEIKRTPKGPERHEALVQECARLRTITRMNDANSTSTEEEISHLLRTHNPFENMTIEELYAEKREAKRACKEIGES